MKSQEQARRDAFKAALTRDVATRLDDSARLPFHEPSFQQCSQILLQLPARTHVDTAPADSRLLPPLP